MTSLVPQKISFIIPAFDEEKVIESTLSNQLDECYGLDIEMIIVDDGSTDATRDIASMFFDRFPCGFVIVCKHAGRGGALTEGIKAATGDMLVLSAADIVLKRNIIEEIINNSYKYDLILLSKNLASSRVLGRDPKRSALSKIFNSMVRMMFNIPFKDTQGVKIGKKEHLEQIIKYCSNKGFILDLELIVYAIKLKYSVVELPWELVFRNGSKTVIKNIHKILFGAFKLWFNITIASSNLRFENKEKIIIKNE